jgi:hypothetical protein
MLFIDNKYTRTYYQIIARAKSRIKPDCYTERHHIIPKSIGGTNDSENLVFLTAREHFICHKLLPKMVTGHAYYKMREALSYFTHNRHRKLSFTSRDIAILRESNSIAASKRNKGNQNYLHRPPANAQLKTLRSNNASASKWVNNGTEEKFTPEYDSLINQEGYVAGRILMPRRTCTVCGFESNPAVIARLHNDKCKKPLTQNTQSPEPKSSNY